MDARVERLEADRAAEAARVMRTSFDDRLPWLAGLHTPAEDEWFFRHVVWNACAVWGAFDRVDLAGVMAVRPGWIDQLYVRPDRQGRGFGTALLAAAKQGATELSLWTFQANAPARSFYERRGFVAVETTDGSRNEEREPDVRYLWRA